MPSGPRSGRAAAPRSPDVGPAAWQAANASGPGPDYGPRRFAHSTSERERMPASVINAAQLTGAAVRGAKFGDGGRARPPPPLGPRRRTLTFLFLAPADPHWTEKRHISGRSVHIILRRQPSCQSPLVAHHLCAGAGSCWLFSACVREERQATKKFSRASALHWICMQPRKSLCFSMHLPSI